LGFERSIGRPEPAAGGATRKELLHVMLGPRYVSRMELRPGSSAALFETLGQLRKNWIKGGWSWDNRFNCLASSFNVEQDGEARAVVLRFLPNEYTAKSIGSAPQQVKEVAESTGGVRVDQRLYSTEMGGRLVAFGLWWPWGDETTISLRIGLGGYVAEADIVRLREVFDALEGATSNTRTGARTRSGPHATGTRGVREGQRGTGMSHDVNSMLVSMRKLDCDTWRSAQKKSS
jgi:hypothetical protein